ncbi:MAG TPA: lipid II flippase MurJ [Gammaproteobacteria bacterium]|nr:lipid II flippase MurJ [Gammaproteobacteria bacterium]
MRNFGSTSRSLFAANGLVGVGLVIGLVNNVAIATMFGLTHRVDAFYAALMLPNLFMALFMDYLGRNFLPAFARARRQSAALASELTSSIVTIVALIAVAVAAVLVLASKPLFTLLLPGFDAAQVSLVSRYFSIMSPVIVLLAVNVFHQYVCQHDEDFVFINAASIALPLANLVAILGLGRFLGEYALPVGYLLGNVTVFALMSARAGYRYSWRIVVRTEWEGKIFFNSTIVMGSGLVARTRVLITNYIASLLGGGAISALAMSSRFIDPLGRTVFTAVKMMMFSRVARLAVDRNSKEIGRLYDVGIGASLLVLAPLIWWIGLNSKEIVEVLLLRGRFDADMAMLVSLALVGGVPAVAFVELGTVLNNAFYALERVATPALVMPLGTLIYLVLAPSFAAEYGVLGLTMSASAVHFAIFVIMTALLARRIESFKALRAFGYVLRYAVIGGSCSFAALALVRLTGLPSGAVSALALPLGVSLYGVVLFALKDRMLGFVYRHARNCVPLPRGARDVSV